MMRHLNFFLLGKWPALFCRILFSLWDIHLDTHRSDTALQLDRSTHSTPPTPGQALSLEDMHFLLCEYMRPAILEDKMATYGGLRSSEIDGTSQLRTEA
jgi:hypothetical protein